MTKTSPTRARATLTTATLTTAALTMAGLVAFAGTLQAQTEKRATPVSDTAAAPASAPAPLVLYFNAGSTKVRPEDEAVLDHASRLFTEGNPIVMVLTGSTDTVGQPDQNLLLSQRRATSVLQGLRARGLPVGRFQVLAKGETEPAVPTAQGAAEPRNRRVEISWR